MAFGLTRRLASGHRATASPSGQGPGGPVYSNRLPGKSGYGEAINLPSSGSKVKAATAAIRFNAPGQPQYEEWDGRDAIEKGYLGHAYIMRCARLRAETIAGLPFVAGPDPEDPSVTDHDAALSRFLGPGRPRTPGGPNPQTTARAFWIWTMCQYIVTGKFAWELERNGPRPDSPIVGLWPLVAPMLFPVPAKPGGEKWFESYVYQTPQGDLPLKDYQCLYHWRMSAKDPRQCESVLQSAMMPAQIAIACDRYMWGLLSQGMVAAKMVVADDFEEEAMRRSWEDQFNSTYTGYDNAGKVLFTYADSEFDSSGKLVDRANVQVIDLAMKSVDAQLLEMVKQAKIDIEIAMGVAESLLGNACLKSDEWVRLADGSRSRAADLVGKSFEVLTSTPGGPAKREAYASWNDVEPTFVVETESGRRLACNDRHPLFAASYTRTKDARWRSEKGPRVDVRGWTRVQDLAVGDLLAVTTDFVSEGAPYDIDAAKVLGYLLGDGCCGGKGVSITFAAEHSAHSDDFARSVEALGDTVRRYKSSGVPLWGISGGAVRKLLASEGLLGSRAHNKHIPPGIWGATLEAQAAFLSRLFATDGCASISTAPSSGRDARGHAAYGCPTITLSSISRDLVADVQEMLMRFGISSRIEGQLAGLGIAERRAYIYHVQVSAAEDVIRFADLIGIYGKEDALNRCCVLATEQLGRKRTPKWRTRHLNPGLRWEKVTSITPAGIDATVAITVPDGNTYLSTFWEHNSQRVFANADSEYRNYWTTTALNDVAELEDAVNLRLAPELDPTETGWFDLSNVVALQPQNVFAPPEITDMISEGVVNAADVQKILNLPALETPFADVNTVPIGEEAVQSGAVGGRSFYRGKVRGEGYRSVYPGMRLAPNVFVKRLPLTTTTIGKRGPAGAGVWRVEVRREQAVLTGHRAEVPATAEKLYAKSGASRAARQNQKAVERVVELEAEVTVLRAQAVIQAQTLGTAPKTVADEDEWYEANWQRLEQAALEAAE